MQTMRIEREVFWLLNNNSVRLEAGNIRDRLEKQLRKYIILLVVKLLCSSTAEAALFLAFHFALFFLLLFFFFQEL
jgi:hypothetical protein